jgi:hypothetical protein
LDGKERKVDFRQTCKRLFDSKNLKEEFEFQSTKFILSKKMGYPFFGKKG